MHWIISLLAIAALWHEGEGNMVARCLPDWDSAPGTDQCYKPPYENWKKSFDEAREYCNGHGGDSLAIKDARTLSWVLSKLESLSLQEAVYTNAKLVDDKWKWLEDDSDVDTNILPLDGQDTGTCGVLLATGTLQGVTCEDEYIFMCHRGIDIPPNCDYLSGYEEMADHCYRISSEQKTWNESLGNCKEEGGSLITINDNVEQRFAKDLCHHRTEYVWIGITEMGHQGDYEWISDEQSNFTSWKEGQPDPTTGGDGCGAIDPEDPDALWVAINGTTNFHDYICEKKQEACVYGWESFGESCYYFNTEGTDLLVWENAKATCEEVGARLVIIEGEDENNFIYGHMEPDDNLWIGLKSKPSDNFYWIDDTVMNFTSMSDQDKGDALAKTDARCVVFHAADAVAWTPIDCYVPRHYVCEVKQGDPIHLIHHPSDKYCPDGWLLNEDKCYYLSEEEKSWQDARQYCQDNQGDLVSINSWAEQDFVHINIKNDIFIGFTDAGQEGTWVWTDGSSTDVLNWNDGEPNGGTNENCGVMYSNEGKWNDWYCDRTHPFGCEKQASDTPIGPTEAPTSTLPPYTSGCDGEGWVENPQTGECYAFILEEKDHYSAQQHCQYMESSGVDLISLSTFEEHAFVWDYIKGQQFSQQRFSIGMRNEYVTGNYWTDNSPVGFFHWSDNEPSGDGFCTEMYVDSGKFNDIDCFEIQAFICEKKGRNYSPPTPPVPPEPICPSGWISFNRHCYLFSANDDTWENAKASCESNLSSVLASIENADENEFLRGNADSLGKDLWLGLRDDDAGSNWHWIDGSEFGQYTNWASGQPDNYQESEHCGEMRHGQGTWNDLPCGNTLAYVCKITLEVCPTGWNFWNEKCYYRSEEVIANDAARQKCKEFNANADLVTIASLRENNYFADLFTQTSQGVWNGYTYDTNSKTWTWDDGSSYPFTNWNDGEPNNMDWELCTEMIDAPYLDTHGKWNNLACTETRNFGCQYLPKHYLGCEVGWQLFGEICYFAGQGKGNYYDSESHCKDLGGQIAPVHSTEENDFLVSILPSGVDGAWIGINDVDQPESFVCADGSSFVYSNWNQLLSDQFNLPRCAAILFDGKWEPRDCSSAGESDTAVICSKPPEAKDITPDESGCNAGDLYYKGSCYSISNTMLSWDEAKNACDREYSNLLRIEDEQEGAFFSSSFGDYGFDAWTDVKVHKYSDESFEFIFDDGKVVTYLPWDSSEPNLGEGDCVLMEGTAGVVGLYKAHACEKELNFICEYDRQGYTTLPPEPTPTHGTNCLENWDHFGGHCYKVLTETHTWTEAEQVCQAYGAHLASINSQEEESFLQQTLWYMYDLTYDNLWVGLQLDTLADKHWTDGSSLDFLHWASGQPEMHEHENCASAYRYDVSLSCTVCETHLPFICEGKEGTVITTLSPPTFEPAAKCTDGEGDWYLYNDNCYKFVSQTDEDPQSWDKSVALCLDEGSHLSSIADVDENFFIESMLSQLSDDFIWVGGRALEDSGFQWVDGSPFAYDNWATGEPNNYMDQEDCIEMYNRAQGKWNDKNCGHLSGRVCKRPNGATVPPPSTTVPPAGNCPENWVHVATTGRCFTYVETVTNFDDAVTSCKNLYKGAELVSLHTPKEMAYITVMIGLYNAEAWIGLKYESEDYVWVDQSTVDYTPWAPGEPNGQYMAEDCVEVIYPTGLMNDIACYNYYNYICAMQQDPSITEPTTFPKCDSPYDNYYKYKEDCYRSEKTAMSWDDAEKTCADEGAHLASAFDMHEGALLWILGQDSSIVHPWIGLNDKRVQSTYEWTDNWPVSYTNWGEDQPQVNVTDKNCVMLDSDDGLWYNEKCEELKPFLCKYSEDQAPSPGPPVAGHCPDDTWTNLPGSYCYLAVTDTKSWNDANAYCLFIDANLTSIHSAEENAVVKHGLKILKSNIWIGLIQKKSGFGWSDGTPLDFLNWADGEPSFDYEQCTEFYQEDGKWNDLSCDNFRPFICRTAKIPDSEPTSPTDAPVPPTDYPYGGDGLSGGAIFGIVIAVIFVFSVVGFVGISYIKRKNGTSGGFSPSQRGGAVVNLSPISDGKGSTVAYFNPTDTTDA